jgi:hypothetical protein
VNIFYFLTDLPIIEAEWYEYEYWHLYLSHAQNSVRLPTQKLQWEVTLSVIAESYAYIMLCEGEDPAESPCYWISLGIPLYTLEHCNVIKRCPHGVEQNKSIYAEKLCGTAVAENDVSVIFQVH